jgi:hypothetical protein
MHQLRNHPLRTLAGLLVLAFALFQLSASGQPGTYWENGPGWLGSIAWIAFLIAALAFVAGAVYTLVRVAVGHRRAA